MLLLVAPPARAAARCWRRVGWRGARSGRVRRPERGARWRLDRRQLPYAQVGILPQEVVARECGLGRHSVARAGGRLRRAWRGAPLRAVGTCSSAPAALRGAYLLPGIWCARPVRAGGLVARAAAWLLLSLLVSMGPLMLLRQRLRQRRGLLRRGTRWSGARSAARWSHGGLGRPGCRLLELPALAVGSLRLSSSGRRSARRRAVRLGVLLTGACARGHPVRPQDDPRCARPCTKCLPAVRQGRLGLKGVLGQHCSSGEANLIHWRRAPRRTELCPPSRRCSPRSVGLARLAFDARGRGRWVPS